MGWITDFWERCPNLEGRERGPIYRRTFELPDGDVLQFTLTPYWEEGTHYNPDAKVKNERGRPMVKRGYAIDGMPFLKQYNVRETLADAKRACELFAQEVAAGNRDPVGGHWINH